MKSIALSILFLIFYGCGDKIQYVLTSPNGSKQLCDSLLSFHYDKDWEKHKDSIIMLGIYKSKNPVNVINSCPMLIDATIRDKRIFKYQDIKQIHNNNLLYLFLNMDTFKLDLLNTINLKGIGINCLHSDTICKEIHLFDSFTSLHINSLNNNCDDYFQLLSNKSIKELSIQLSSFDTTIINNICSSMQLDYLNIKLDKSAFNEFDKILSYALNHKSDLCLKFLSFRNLKLRRKQLIQLNNILIPHGMRLYHWTSKVSREHGYTWYL